MSPCRSRPSPVGAVHPITALMDLMEDVFVAMGWEVAEGPELEAEWLNFDALNFIPDHPGADHAGHAVRRAGGRRHRAADPHLAGAGPDHARPASCRSTSSAPAGCTASDEYDATHLPVFHQIEGLAVDKGITLGAPARHS